MTETMPDAWRGNTARTEAPSREDPRPFRIYRDKRGWPRWYQRFAEAWWIITRQHSLHTAWQAGYNHGTNQEYRRTVINGGR